MRECRKCHGSFPEADFAFAYNKKKRTRRHVCKRCRLARTKELYAIDPSKGRARALASYYRNKDQYIRRFRVWEAANPDKVRQHRRNADLKRSDSLARRKQRHESYLKNKDLRDKDKLRASGRKYDLTRIRRRRMRLNEAVIRDLTAEQWQERLEEFDYHCAYCWASGVKLTQDHLIPISRGGHHTIDNIVPACTPCNSRKKNRSMLEVLTLVS